MPAGIVSVTVTPTPVESSPHTPPIWGYVSASAYSTCWPGAPAARLLVLTTARSGFALAVNTTVATTGGWATLASFWAITVPALVMTDDEPPGAAGSTASARAR